MSLLKRLERGTSGGNQNPAGYDANRLSPDLLPEDPEENKLAAMRVRRQAPGAERSHAAPNTYLDLKTRVQNRLLAELDQSMDLTRTAEVRAAIEELFNAILSEEAMVLSRAERQRLFESIVAEILGYGPLEPLLADESITEIMVNGPKNVFVERTGNLSRPNVTFEDDDHVLRILDRIVAPLGRRIDESSPLVVARLP